jgi:sugar/nucleoside kinase (ribokinase family)
VIAVAGEALIDLVERDGTLHPLPGGGPFNTAAALGRFRVPLEDALSFACAVASLQCSRAGAAPPTLAEVDGFWVTRT